MSPPASTVAPDASVAVDAVLVMPRSATRPPTVAAAIAVLLAGTGSIAGVLKTRAVLVMVSPGTADALTRTTRAIVALAPLANAPTVQVIGPEVKQLRWATRTRLVPAGMLSVSDTLSASDGPALVAGSAEV